MTTMPRRVDLVLLRHDVDDAREACRAIREAPHCRRELTLAQKRLAHALEAYAAAVAIRDLALPHRLRVELTVYRSLVSNR